jgi:hypothetical protein
MARASMGIGPLQYRVEMTQVQCHLEGRDVTLFIIGSLFGLTVLTPMAVILTEAVKIRIEAIYWLTWVVLIIMALREFW